LISIEVFAWAALYPMAPGLAFAVLVTEFTQPDLPFRLAEIIFSLEKSQFQMAFSLPID
jgi:uncharacterized membrane protein YjjB (DUF3815 family)